MPYRPRAERDRELVRAAKDAAKAGGGSAMDVALAQIGAGFGEAAAINGFKMRIELYLRAGPHSRPVQARFGARAERLTNRNLDAAVFTVERAWREERKAFQIASALGCGSRLSVEVLRELRLILRLMRWKRLHAEFAVIIAALCDEEIAEAAE